MGTRTGVMTIGLALAAGVLFAFANTLHPYWPAAWLAPAALLAAVAVRPRAALSLGFAAGLIGGAGLFVYYCALALPAAAVGITIANAAATAGAAKLAAIWLRRASAAAVLAYPATAAAAGYLSQFVSPHGSAGSLAVGQMDFLPAMQVASLGGAAAVVFLTALPGAALGVAVARGRAAWRTVAATLAVVALALVWGAWRAGAASRGETLRVALMASDRWEGIPKGFDDVLAAYRPALSAAAARGARIAVLPEKIAVLTPAEAAPVRQALQDLARATGMTVVAGALAVTPDDRLFNRALVAFPDGGGAQYDKRHLVPGWERTQTPGVGDLVLPGSPAKGVAICKDLDFPGLGRAYAKQDVALMLVPAWDFAGGWGDDAWLHSRTGLMRAVEDRVFEYRRSHRTRGCRGA